MKTYNQYQLWIVIICGLLLVLQGCSSQHTINEVKLDGLLTDPECKSSCWQGIEPEVTRRDQLIEYLEENNIEYTTIPETPGTGLEYFDWSVSNSTLSSEGKAVMVNVAVGGTLSQVGYISIGQIDLCVVTVIRDFGLPTVVIHEPDDTSYTLVYPTDGLVFLSDAQLMKIYSFSIRSEQVIEEEFVTGVDPKVSQVGSSIEDLISEDCVDRLNQ